MSTQISKRTTREQTKPRTSKPRIIKNNDTVRKLFIVKNNKRITVNGNRHGQELSYQTTTRNLENDKKTFGNERKSGKGKNTF